MDRKKMKHWSIAGVFAIFVLASLWHFVYDKLPSPVLGAISPVNESPWEHAKLFFIPAILFFVVEYLAVGRRLPNYVFAHSVALLIMPAVMLALYYIYQSFIDETLALDIINAFVTVLVGVFIAFTLTVSGAGLSRPWHYVLSVIIVAGMLVLYAVFTFHPPECGLFLDQTTMRYGI